MNYTTSKVGVGIYHTGVQVGEHGTPPHSLTHSISCHVSANHSPIIVQLQNTHMQLITKKAKQAYGRQHHGRDIS
jgi:hypothetical protein